MQDDLHRVHTMEITVPSKILLGTTFSGNFLQIWVFSENFFQTSGDLFFMSWLTVNHLLDITIAMSPAQYLVHFGQ